MARLIQNFLEQLELGEISVPSEMIVIPRRPDLLARLRLFHKGSFSAKPGDGHRRSCTLGIRITDDVARLAVRSALGRETNPSGVKKLIADLLDADMKSILSAAVFGGTFSVSISCVSVLSQVDLPGLATPILALEEFLT